MIVDADVGFITKESFSTGLFVAESESCDHNLKSVLKIHNSNHILLTK